MAALDSRSGSVRDVHERVAQIEEENAALRDAIARTRAERRRVDTVRTRVRPLPRSLGFAFVGLGLVVGGAVGIYVHDADANANATPKHVAEQSAQGPRR